MPDPGLITLRDGKYLAVFQSGERIFAETDTDGAELDPVRLRDLAAEALAAALLIEARTAK